MTYRLLGLFGIAVAVTAGIAWLRASQPAEASPLRYLEVRLAQPEELSPRLQAADPLGSAWARHYEENLPARVARECGVRRFDVRSASDFFQAVDIPASDSTEALARCLVARGGGYLRLSVLNGGDR